MQSPLLRKIMHVALVASLLISPTAALAQSGDITLPTVSITAPAAGATVSATTAINAFASDNVGVAKVEFLVDGALKSTDTAPPFSYSWDTANAGAHPCIGTHQHSLTAKAYDAAGNFQTSALVTVAMEDPAHCNPPPPAPPPPPPTTPEIRTDAGTGGTGGGGGGGSNPAVPFGLGLLSGLALSQAISQMNSSSNYTRFADIQCQEFRGRCPYRQKCNPSGPNPPNPNNTGIIGKVCGDPRGVIGECTDYDVCTARRFAGVGGGMSGIGGQMNPLGSIMQLLGAAMQLGAMGQQGGMGGFGGTGITGGVTGCAQYYPVTTPSSDPCAYFVPPASGSVSTGIDTGTGTGGSGSSNPVSDLINSIGGENNPISSLIDAIRGGGATSSATGKGVGGVTGSTASGTKAIGPGGVSGEIRVLPNGVTIVVTNPDQTKNTVTAGFLGTQVTGGAQPQGIIASWCRTRPWAKNFLSFIIPPVFFDNLCTLRGYKVGEELGGAGPAQVGSQVTLTQTRVTARPSTTAPTVPQSPPMTVDIWAVPPSVPLGARTTIFWTSKNAASCTETSPEGNFSHTTLSGGGATVPLSGPTTFTISCIAPDGTHATDYVTVQLAI